MIGWLPNGLKINWSVIGSTDVRWCLVGIQVPAIQPWHADRQTERRKKRKKEKREKHKSANVMHHEINQHCTSTIPKIDQKQYCNLLLQEKKTVFGINKLHILSIIIHHTTIQHTQKYYTATAALLKTTWLYNLSELCIKLAKYTLTVGLQHKTDILICITR